MSHRCVLVLLVVLATVPLGARPQEEHQRTFEAATTAVVVDVVVRDRRGNPVTDLRKEDFELLEDGVRQEIADLTLVAPAASRKGAALPVPAPDAALPPGTTVPTPTFVALAFDRLSPEGRALAHKGALAYLETARENDFAGVFVVDNRLEMVETFTNDRTALRHAIDAAASRATANFTRQNDRVRSSGMGETAANTPPTAGSESGGQRFVRRLTTPSGQRDPNIPRGDAFIEAEANLERITNQMERSYESMMRDQQGFATTNALLALLDGLGVMPGRKTVVLFAEGLAIPAAVQARFDSVVTAANKANVSIYTVDAAGLRVHSQAAETARGVQEVADTNLDRVSRGDGGGGAFTKELEINEDVLKQDASVSLGILAQRTGGFLINNTNALERGFRTIDADRRFHYLLTYTPKNDNFDGGWRNVTVKVPKRRVEIRARSGYQAVRTASAIPVLAWEVSALALLDRPTPPRDIPIRAGVLTFPMTGPESRVPILVGVPADRVAFEVTDTAFRTDFTILTRVLDAAGEVVRKGSQPYRLNGPREQVEAARAGEVLFYRQPSLEPGTYTLEVAVLDAFARRGTVERQTFTVPPATGLGVSSLVVVGRGEQVAAGERDADNPLYVGDVLVYPNLGEPVRKGDAGLTLFVTVTGAERPTGRLELLREGAGVADVPLAFDPPANGRIQQLWRIPTEPLAAGHYSLRLTVQHAGARTVREASVVLHED
jgi:VWFA-related protein